MPSTLLDTMLPNVNPETAAKKSVIINKGYDPCQCSVSLHGFYLNYPFPVSHLSSEQNCKTTSPPLQPKMMNTSDGTIYVNSKCKHCKYCLVLGVYYGCYDCSVFTVKKWTTGVNSPTWYANIF